MEYTITVIQNVYTLLKYLNAGSSLNSSSLSCNFLISIIAGYCLPRQNVRVEIIIQIFVRETQSSTLLTYNGSSNDFNINHIYNHI